MIKKTFFVFAALLFMASNSTYAEEPAKEQPSVPPQANRPIPTTLVEISTDALPLWRQASENNGPKTLIVFSNEPFLQPIPVQLEKDALNLAKNGTSEQLVASGRYFRPDPLLLPSQAISAALACDFFDHVLWVIPAKTAVKDFDLESFRQQLYESGILTRDESQKLTLQNNSLIGSIRGKNFTIATTKSLPPLIAPAWVHLDLSYFQALYKNEIKTPIYSLLYSLAARLTTADLPITGATLSLSTEEEGLVKMNMRFIGKDFAEILMHPEKFHQKPSPVHSLRSDAYYYANLMASDKAFAKIQEATKAAPDDGGLLYDYYLALRVAKRGDDALHILDRLVALDPGYGYEYLSLAKQAKEKNLPAASLGMLKKARQLYPNNHYIRLEMLDRYLELGQLVEAKAQLDKLTLLPWSKVYYPNMPEILKGYRKRIE